MAGNESIMNVEDVARALYGTPEGERPSKSQLNSVASLCRNGKLQAMKAGKRWLIRMEWPTSNGG